MFFCKLFHNYEIFFKVEDAVPNVPILSDDRPYTIEVFDCAKEDKIEVLRINIANKNQSPRIEMGKGAKNSAKVHPLELDENSTIVPTNHKLPQYTKDEPKSIKKEDGDENENKIDVIEGDSPEDGERQQWSNPVEFLLSCVAMSVGLGST